MNEINKILDRMKIAFNVSTYAEVAHKLGMSPSTLDTWKRRKEIPEVHILKCVHLTGYDENFIKYGTKKAENSSHIVNGNGNISFSGSGNTVSGNNTASSAQTINHNDEIKEVFDLLQEYGSPKMIKELKDRLLQIKALHG